MKVIFISGWGSPKSVWEETASQVKSIDPLFISWADGLEEPPEQLLNHQDQVILVGWSLGAVLALLWNLHYPKAVSHLLLVSGTARMSEDTGYPGIPCRTFDKMIGECTTPHLLLNRFSNLLFYPEKSVARSTFVESGSLFSREELSDGLIYLKNCDLRSRLGELKNRVTVVHGEADEVIPLSQAHYLAANLGCCHFVPLAKRGHALPYTATTSLSELISNIVEESP